MTTKKNIKSALEAMMFTWGEPLDSKTCSEVLEVEPTEVYDMFIELQREYLEEGRGIEIRRVDKSFQFVTAPINGEYIRRLCTPVKKRKLSQSAMETLAIVAYKQPVTRGEIESIRGIKCERVVEGLSKKEMIEEKGRSNGIGRPILYGTTAEFLKRFNFESLDDLPELDDIEGIYEEENFGSADFQQITMENLSE